MVSSPFEYYAFPHQTTYLNHLDENFRAINSLPWSSLRCTGIIDDAPRQQQLSLGISRRSSATEVEVSLVPLTPEAIIHTTGPEDLDGLLARSERWYLPAVLSELSMNLHWRFRSDELYDLRYARNRNPELFRANVYPPRGPWTPRARSPPTQEYPMATLTLSETREEQNIAWFLRDLPPVFGNEVQLSVEGVNIPEQYQALLLTRKETHGARLLQGTSRKRLMRQVLEYRLRARPLNHKEIGDHLGLCTSYVLEVESHGYCSLGTHRHQIRAIHDARTEEPLPRH
jgi:hypothetical protein